MFDLLIVGEVIMREIPTKKQAILQKRGIQSAIDLLYNFPHRFTDYSSLKELDESLDGHYIATYGELTNVNLKKNGHTSTLTLRFEQNGITFRANLIGVANMKNYYKSFVGVKMYILGKVQYSEEWGYSFMDPDYVGDNKYALKIWNKYPKYADIGADWYEGLVKEAFNELEIKETIPDYILEQTKLPSKKEMFENMIYPKSEAGIRKAVQRNVFEDQLYFAIKVQLADLNVSKGSEFNLKFKQSVDKTIASLPYDLTPDQANTLDKIFSKMRDGRRVSALIQGDVGCGKSIIGFLLMLAMADSGYQSVIMAPTVVLAEQHYKELLEYASNCGYNVAFLGGKQTAKEKREILKGIASGETKLIVGTHSVISDDVVYKNLAMTLVDEEHRFGVAQREKLTEKASKGVHTIQFSATPIPRSMAKTIYSDTDVYEIKTMPKGRSPIKTAVYKNDTTAINFLKNHIANGEQAYIVCPLIDKEDSEGVKPRTVAEMEKLIKEQVCEEVGIVTGKQSKKTTQEELDKFKAGETKVLVATTVVEVGVNVPNATVIIIENSELFGLAQLHQLRGRVGRGAKQGYCLLHSQKNTERLEVMCNTTDGFKIAEEDLKLRGAGNVLGDEQSGNNRFLDAAVSYPKMYEHAKFFAQQMVANNTYQVLIDEMERRSEKIYLKASKVRFLH